MPHVWSLVSRYACAFCVVATWLQPLLKMYGYKKGEIEGKNVSLLMPQPFSNRHNGFLRNYITTGKAKILNTVREVRHRDPGAQHD
jgi:PAS domain S-box-containing protein